MPNLAPSVKCASASAAVIACPSRPQPKSLVGTDHTRTATASQEAIRRVIRCDRRASLSATRCSCTERFRRQHIVFSALHCRIRLRHVVFIYRYLLAGLADMIRPPIFLLLLVNILVAESRGQTLPPNPPGRLVDVGGYRLHLNCTGRRKQLPRNSLPLPGTNPSNRKGAYIARTRCVRHPRKSCPLKGYS